MAYTMLGIELLSKMYKLKFDRQKGEMIETEVGLRRHFTS